MFTQIKFALLNVLIGWLGRRVASLKLANEKAESLYVDDCFPNTGELERLNKKLGELKQRKKELLFIHNLKVAFSQANLLTSVIKSDKTYLSLYQPDNNKCFFMIGFNLICIIGLNFDKNEISIVSYCQSEEEKKMISKISSIVGDIADGLLKISIKL